MATKLKHSRGVDKRIKTLADKLGLRIMRRDGELWADGDVQLTFRYHKVKGEMKALDDEGRIDLAIHLLEGIDKARAAWPTVRERYAAIINGLEKTVPQHRPRCYTYFREQSLDEGWMFNSGYNPKWEMGVRLVGRESIQVNGPTAEACIVKLRRHVPPGPAPTLATMETNA